jgi:nitrate/TMAO reductase-like tetraheme cytochrome c subunit
MFFIGGLILIPIGVLAQRRKERLAKEKGQPLPEFPVIDMNKEKVRKTIVIVAALTALNLVIIATAFYKGLEVMDSTAFCGSCHSVMDPEATTHKRSPHARVKCVECHIGAGASWFVKSKLSGSWQLISVTFGLYQKPIPTPVHNLRPARETCEQCHWPTKFVGDRLKVITRYGDDEKNTEKKTVVLMRIGGSQGTKSHGIHWHVDPGVHIRYLADEKRENIREIELERADGTKKLFKPSGKAPEGVKLTWRTMDCIDCHNRPSHVYKNPSDEIDAAIIGGKIDKSLPFVHREGMRLLKETYASQAEAESKIKAGLEQFYKQTYADVATAKATVIAQAADELARIYKINVWPNMNIKWGSYPSYIGHDNAPGCFRCHDDDHKAEDNKTISQSCNLCHSVLANDEADPKILKDLQKEM